MSQFSVVNVATALHRIAKSAHRGIFRDPRMRAVLAKAEEVVTYSESLLQPQELASMAWAVSKLSCRDKTLIAV